MYMSCMHTCTRIRVALSRREAEVFATRGRRGALQLGCCHNDIVVEALLNHTMRFDFWPRHVVRRCELKSAHEAREGNFNLERREAIARALATPRAKGDHRARHNDIAGHKTCWDEFIGLVPVQRRTMNGPDWQEPSPVAARWAHTPKWRAHG